MSNEIRKIAIAGPNNTVSVVDARVAGTVGLKEKPVTAEECEAALARPTVLSRKKLGKKIGGSIVMAIGLALFVLFIVGIATALAHYGILGLIMGLIFSVIVALVGFAIFWTGAAGSPADLFYTVATAIFKNDTKAFSFGALCEDLKSVTSAFANVSPWKFDLTTDDVAKVIDAIKRAEATAYPGDQGAGVVFAPMVFDKVQKEVYDGRGQRVIGHIDIARRTPDRQYSVMTLFMSFCIVPVGKKYAIIRQIPDFEEPVLVSNAQDV